ncbi:fibronectin type III domain-containing protein [Aurantibacter aestuarii]|uniref:Metallophosphoesterase n=1 Tax=Aurantibacter aestuarii TaxID=1266046 RepID=A0A2T1NFM3_9FLAO|nr:fibronectin type III domain-containing protein [Aurantibacter aestuarii]PSG91574.1 metallophosphoesterase [Aurantibacter aestuarii]
MKHFNALLVLIAFAFATKSLHAQTIKPYLQAAKSESVWVSWKTDNENGTNPTVIYGLTANNLNLNATGTRVNLEPQDPGYNTPYHWHNVKLIGLTPDTGYYYQVKSGASDESTVHYFKTPKAEGSSSGKLRFIFLGDHQLINYQGQPYYKFNELVQAAKDKAEQLYGTPIADHINLIVNDGDQVDLGNLTHYEKIHFEKQNIITPSLPLITAVGNHEVYGSMGINAYYEHFILDDNLTYQGINSNTERYYAYQMENVLFVVFDTELQGNTQTAWGNAVINAAKNDANVDWIITTAHRPFQAEQYSNDYSPWYNTTILPNLKTTDKFVLHVAGHHHLYSRGQFKDHNGYHMISGGTAWPQYWGDSNNETDHEETIGSWSNFAYQIMEIDNDAQEFKVQSYTIGSLTTSKNNELLDEFHYKKNSANPDTPTVTNTITAPVNLPYTFNSSAYSTTSSEAYYSTQFQISSASDFSILEVDRFRSKDNFYGPAATTDETANIGEGLGIFDYTVNTNQLNNGTHFIRVRHRDENLKWSNWSAPLSFTVTGSIDGTPNLELSSTYYNVSEPVQIDYTNGPGNNTDWIGLYKKGQTPGGPASTSWSYVNGNTSGNLSLTIANNAANKNREYFVVFFENDTYTEVAPRKEFWFGDIPTLTSDFTEYNLGDPVNITYANSPFNTNDWIAIYKVGFEPGVGTNTTWQYTDAINGTRTFNNLPKGYYYATYHILDGYKEIGERVYFQVGDQITNISTNKTTYDLDEEIQVTFNDGPGLEKDWLGIFNDGDTPGTDQLFTYKYFDGLANGTTTISETSGTSGEPNQVPDTVGDYFIVMFTDDSYDEVSNRVYFNVVDNTLSTFTFDEKEGKNIKLFPNPIEDFAKIEANHNISKLELFNLNGKKLFDFKNVNKREFKLEKGHLASGTYLLKIHADKIYEMKIVIK